MRRAIFTAILLGAAIAYSQTATSGETAAAPTHEQLLVSAQKVALIGSVGYVAATGLALNPSADKAQQSLEKEVARWGRFTVVDDPARADLVLVLFEGNRSTGGRGTIRTARLVVFAGGAPPRKGDIPLYDDSDNGGLLLPTSAAPKVIGVFRKYLEALDKTTAHIQLPTAVPPSTSAAVSPAPSPAPAPDAAAPAQLETERPHKYADPLRIISDARTYTIRGSGAAGERSALDKALGPFGNKSADVHDAMLDVYRQMSDWGRMQYVDEVPKADIVLSVYQWDIRAETRYPAVRSAMNVAQGGEAYQREDPALWTSGTQNGETKGLIAMLRLDVEQYAAPLPSPAQTGNSDYERGAKEVDSAGKKKYQNDQENTANEAIHDLRQSMRTGYAYPLAHARLADALRLARFHVNAAYEYKRALQLQPDMPEALRGLFSELMAINDYDEALSTAGELIRVAPDSADSYLALGQAEYWKENYPAAAAAYRNAIQREPSRAILHQRLGRALFRDRHWPDAEAAFREALRINPGDVETLTWLGGTLNEQQRPADALPFLRQAEAKEKNDSDLHYHLARALRGTGQYNDALSEIRAALAKAPDTFAFHMELAQTLESAGKHDEALAEFRNIVAHSPAAPRAHAELGIQLLSMTKNDEAAAELQKAIDLDAKCARAWFYLGRLRESKGDQPGAKTAYETARALEPENEAFRN